MKFRHSRCVLSLSLAVFICSSAVGSVRADEGRSHQQSAESGETQAEQKISASLAKLAPEDRKQAEAQRFCAVMEYGRLGSMGTPIKVLIEGKPVFVCCKGCTADAVEGAKQTLAKTQKLKQASAVLAKLSPADRAAAEAQKYCAVAEGSFLGGMGAPVKLMLSGKPVFLCCKACVTKAQANPEATLAKVAELKEAGASDGHAEHKHN